MDAKVLVRRVVVAGLALVMALGVGFMDLSAPEAVAKKPDPQWFQQPKGVDVKAAGEKKLKKTPKVEQRSLRKSWPAGDKDRGGHRVRVGRGQKARAGSSPVWISPSVDTGQVSVDATVRMLPQEQARKLVGDGVVFSVELPAGASAEVALDYSAFADVVGAGFGSRLKLVSLPACGLSTPEDPECQVQSELMSVNDPAAQKVSTIVDVPGATEGERGQSSKPGVVTPSDPVGAATAGPADVTDPSESPQDKAEAVEPGDASGKVSEFAPQGAGVLPGAVDELPQARAAMVLAAVAGSSSGQGDFTATSFNPSSSWSAGGGSGDFSWSYPIEVPNVPGGIGPSLGLAYSSGVTDGYVPSTNNQGSWVGEGFDFAASFIERKYVSCAGDQTGGNNKSSSTGDLCWFTDSTKTNNQKWDNAFLSMGAVSGALVRVGNTNEWRLEADDGTRVRKLGAVSAGEYWQVVTPDGTQYFFGKGKADGASAPATNSVWQVPVNGNHSGEPGYASTFAGSFKTHPWRWNLDYVVSPTGQTMTLYYAKESSRYLKNLSLMAWYDRGGYLTRIEYGDKRGSETGDGAPGRVSFTVEERCDTSVSSTCMSAAPQASTTAAWPDVPLDALCDGSFCPSPKAAPTFFTRKRLASVSTFTRNAANTGFDAVDRWNLGYSWLAPADGSAPTLWLSTITRTGLTGGSVALPATRLSPTMLVSSITGPPVSRPRLAMITTESGGQTSVTYSVPGCTSTTVPSKSIAANTTRCMPTYAPMDAVTLWPQVGSANLVVDIAGGSTALGAAAQLAAPTGAVSQGFRLTPVPGGFQLVNVKSGRCLTVNGTAANGRTILQQKCGTGNDQIWALQDNADSSVTFVSKLSSSYVLDVKDGKAAAGNPLQLWGSNNTGSQKFNMTVADTSAPDGMMFWSELGDGLVVDIDGGSVSTGAAVQVWGSNGTPAQKFRLVPAGSGFQIVNLKSGLCVTANGTAAAKGLALVQQTCNTSANRLWTPQANSDGTTTFVSLLDSGYVMDVKGGAGAVPGTKVQLYTANSTAAQRYTISVAGATPVLRWFNKYVVTKVVDHDVTPVSSSAAGLGLDITGDVTTTYSYAGTAWHYDDSPFTPEQYRTWGQWRGYSKVTTNVGTGAAKQVSETTFFQGLNGDKAASGTKTVKLTDSTGATWTDEKWLAGMVRETRVLNGAVEDSGQVMDPWVSAVTATDGRLSARQVDVAQTRSRQKLSSGTVRQARETVKTRDTYGQPTQVESEGDLAVTGDEQCV